MKNEMTPELRKLAQKPFLDLTDEELDRLLDVWAEEDDEESFVGFQMKEEKRLAYERLLLLGEVLVRSIKGAELLPCGPDNRERNAEVRLRLPVLCFAPDQEALKKLTVFLSAADRALLTSAGDRGMLLTAEILDVWSEEHEILKGGAEHE